jgi:hypothetical protein
MKWLLPNLLILPYIQNVRPNHPLLQLEFRYILYLTQNKPNRRLTLNSVFEVVLERSKFYFFD